MTTLQKIVTAAKKLKKQYPNRYSKWTDYIKAASKEIKKPGKKIADVNVTYRSKKEADYLVERKKNGRFKGTVRLAGVKKKPAAKHTDKGSHNTNIKVVSGTNNFYISQLKTLTNEIDQTKKYIETLKQRLTTYKTKEGKTFFRAAIKEQRNKIVLLKHQLTLVKKGIK